MQSNEFTIEIKDFLKRYEYLYAYQLNSEKYFRIPSRWASFGKFGLYRSLICETYIHVYNIW